MDQMNDDEKKIIKRWFQETEYKDFDEAFIDRDILIAKMIYFSEEEGRDSVDILVRRIVLIKINGKDKDIKYKFTVSRHEAGSMDNLKFFDSSLVTYYMNGLKGKKPEIRHMAGNSALGKSLKHYTEEEINRVYDELIKQGRDMDAKSYITTWEIAKKHDVFETVNN